jgi:hypothetical protein
LFLKWKFGHWEKASLNIAYAYQWEKSTMRKLGMQHSLLPLFVLPSAISLTSSSIAAAPEAGIAQSVG